MYESDVELHSLMKPNCDSDILKSSIILHVHEDFCDSDGPVNRFSGFSFISFGLVYRFLAGLI